MTVFTRRRFNMAVDWEMKYDRRVDESFLDNFAKGGFATSLVQYARDAPYPVDLQFRKNAKTNAQHASLYVGLTSVLNVEAKSGNTFRLTADQRWADSKHNWDSTWGAGKDAAYWSANWRDVETYLESVIPIAAEGRHASKEGSVQAAVCSFRGGKQRAMLDREVMPSFKDARTKKKILEDCAAPLLEALKTMPAPGKPPAGLGPECDVLAIDTTEQRLIAVEVKPSKTSTLVWAPAQATMYASVLTEWMKRDEDWFAVVEGMVEQRRRLGLIPRLEMSALKREVIPAVAVQRGANTKYMDRMWAVQDALVAAGAGHPDLKVYEVSLSGRLDSLEHP